MTNPTARGWCLHWLLITNSMEVWWIGADGSVWDAYWYEGGLWNQFQLAPPGSASTYGGITAVSRMPNTMEVMWIGQDGSVWDAYWYAGQPWNRYQVAPPNSASVNGRSITAVSRMPNTIEIWWIGPDGSVQDAYGTKGHNGVGSNWLLRAVLPPLAALPPCREC